MNLTAILQSAVIPGAPIMRILFFVLLSIISASYCKGKAVIDSPSVDIYINGVRSEQTVAVDLGNMLQNSPARSFPVTIRNTGSQALNLTNLVITVNTNSAFTLSGLQTPLTLNAAGEVTGSLILNPLVADTTYFSAAVTTDNSALRAFNINCRLMVISVPSPEIAIRQGTTDLISGGSAFNLGNLLVGSNYSTTFTLYNLGTANLNLGGTPLMQIGGTDAADFSVVTQPASSVAPLNFTNVVVQYNPSSPGAKSAYLKVISNDSDEAVFVLNLSATAQVPYAEINVMQNGSNYPSGSTYTYYSTIAGGTYDATFTLQNQGTGNLTLSGSPIVAITGANAADFSVQNIPASTITAAGSAAFTVRFRPTSAGTKNASFLISNNDANEGSYEVFLTANVTAPEIAVRADFNGAYIYATSGTAMNLGFADSGSGTTRYFRIENTGNQTLQLTGNPPVQFTGAHAADFSVTTAPVTSITPGSAYTFAVLIKPTAVGNRTATMIIPNNDFDEGPFTIPVTLSGNAFEQKAQPANYWKVRAGAKSVVFDNKIFLFTGYPSDIWSSADGVTWNCRNSSPGWGFNLQNAVVHAGKILVFDGSKIWQSFDGSNFSVAVSSPPWSDRTGMAVVSFNGTLYLLGGYSSWMPAYYNDVWTSPDGINWVKISSSSPWGARSGMYAAVHNGKIFMVGGTSFRDVWTTTDGISWSQVSNNSIPVRNDAAMVSFGGKLYIYGGKDNSSVLSADVYSTTTGASFTLETGLPGFAPRILHTAVVLGSKVFVMTGNAASTGSQRDVYDSADAINFTALAANADIFEPRWGHQVVNLNGKLILTGGKDVLGNHRNDSWTSTNGTTWSMKNGNAPWSARRGHTFTIHNNVVYLIAGGTAASVGNVNREVWQTTDGINYSLVTSNPPFPARFHHTAASFGGKLWIFGGVGAAGTQLNDAWYSTDAINWIQAPNIPKTIEGATMTVHGGELYLSGGFCSTCTPPVQNNVYKSPDGLVWTELTGGSLSASVGQIGVSYANRLWLLAGSGVAQGATLIASNVYLVSYNIPFGIRDNAGYALFNDGNGEKLWVFGGGISGNASNDIMTMEALP